MRKEIELEERRSIQLEMLKEIHSFCNSNNIRYSLAYGTLLGAIRHKGFIPWDDDLDIMMPLPDMFKFKVLFKSEKLKYCDIDTEKNFNFPFSRISYLPTYRRMGFYKEYGISIDLYPVCQIPDTKETQNEYFQKLANLYERREKVRGINAKFRKCFSLSFPMYKSALRDIRDFICNNCEYGSTNTYHVVAGPISTRNKRIYDYDIFKDIILVEFENIRANAISCYSDFLRVCYGDYMQLPPESERHPYHNGHYYWRNR